MMGMRMRMRMKMGRVWDVIDHLSLAFAIAMELCVGMPELLSPVHK